MKRILGFDPSLTASGYALGRAVGVLTPPSSVGKGAERNDWILSRFLELAANADVVAMEDYSYASQGRAILSIAELGGLIRWACWKRRISLATIAPGTLKKFAAGAGNAGKEEMLAAAIRRLGYDGHDHNVADAMFLREAGLHAYGHESATPLPKVQIEALKVVAWPGLPAPEPKPKKRRKGAGV